MWVSEPDRGIYDAMNKGIRLSTGEIIGTINADDFYAEPDVLARVAALFEDPAIDVCYGDLCYVGYDDPTRIVRYWRSSEFKPDLFLYGWCPPHPTFFVRRSVYDRLGTYDESYKIAADVDLTMRYLEKHRVRSRYLPQVLVKMRMGGSSNKSIRNVIQQNREIWAALRKHGLELSQGVIALARAAAERREASAVAISRRVVTAASGIPLPMPLAIVMMSGTTSQLSHANHLPVRPKPAMISSAISRIPCRSQIPRRPSRKPSSGTM